MADGVIDLAERAEPPETAATRGRWRGHTMRRALVNLPARELTPERRDLIMHGIREGQHTARFAIAALTLLLGLVCLIPIANGRPRHRQRQGA